MKKPLYVGIFPRSFDESTEETQVMKAAEEGLLLRVFWHYARAWLPEMKLLFRAGRLSKKYGDWNNVINHCLIQGAEAHVLSALLGLSVEESNALEKAAFVHDWNKRLEIKPGDFSQDQKTFAKDSLWDVSPDKDILAATSPCFSKKIINGEATLLQELMFYLDDITSGGDIVGYPERIKETRARRTDLDEDLEITEKLGGKFWDVELEACRLVEEKIFRLLIANEIEIHLPQDIPSLIKAEVMKEVHFSGSSHG